MEEHHDHCPCCGEPITLLIDTSVQEQEYVEDCEVCCRPMIVRAWADAGSVSATVRAEND
ncbi:CPXCG motif-containing cysteine-rich protein [Pseudohalioglobus lutimaris]|uniref:CPXCG motif-containing cysteine-rich protein n=1 Tax=Pseudohalioglobus lutimaris TaxID=1737061 RepID=A0A2N5X8B8_9GAMM|nr:CPXCG motif-containing cysteine-rich protein [Pseudohalioglobus lutimaris]PLW70709.1 CPXCG motif-containing cysteine-rich protein [Pseudohalioglobus lutimaris]